jgi:hypothetical protein
VDTLAAQLRALAEPLGLLPLAAAARAPNTTAVYRLTIRRGETRLRDQAATLRQMRGETTLAVVYRAFLNHKPLLYPVVPERLEAFVKTLQAVRFDALPDQPDPPSYGADLWLLERAAGSFYKSLLLAPALAAGPYTDLVKAVQTHLPEALRPIAL